MSQIIPDTVAGSPKWSPLLDLSPIAAALAQEFTLVRVNRAMCDLLGRPAEDLIGRDVRSFVSAGDRPVLDDLERHLVEGNAASHATVGFERPDGRECTASLTAVVLERPGASATSQVLVQVVDMTETYRHQRAMSAAQRRNAKLVTNIRDIIAVLDADGVLKYSTANDVGALGFGPSHWQGLEGVVVLDAVHPDDRERAAEAWRTVIDVPGEAVDLEVRMSDAEGHWTDIVFTGMNLLEDPDVGGVILTARNVSDLRRAEQIASWQATVLELIARGAPAAEILDRCVDLLQRTGRGGSTSIMLLEDGRLVTRASRHGDDGPAPTVLPGMLCDRIVDSGRPIARSDVPTDELDEEVRDALVDVGIRAYWAQPIMSQVSNRVVGACCATFDHPHEITEEELAAAELTASLVTIALERIDTERQLAHQALHDGLTGLPNRTLLLDRLDHALARRERTGSAVAVLFCDLDRFKVVNDSLGHGVGDQILVAAAARIEATLSKDDTVARFGGDEFVILLEDVDDDHVAIDVANKISDALSHPFELPGGQDVYLTTSIGIAYATDHGSGDGWLRDADAAMYRAKEKGRDQLVVFDTAMREDAMARLQVEHDLRRGLDRGELVVHYLPTIDLASGRIVGGEALVRWHHPERGLLSPGEFVPVAEETGVIDEVGRFVLDVATRDIARMVSETAVPEFQLGINISARQIAAGDVAEWVKEVCDRHGWPLDHLLLEVTETALALGVADPSNELARVAELGVNLAIDDFGTGHSSLTRLSQLPVSQVKVDRSFVGNIGEDPSERSERPARIVEAVVALAKAMDLRTCAEGVETGAQLDHLRRLGCHLAQGYLFSKPLPLDRFAELVAADPRWLARPADGGRRLRNPRRRDSGAPTPPAGPDTNSRVPPPGRPGALTASAGGARRPTSVGSITDRSIAANAPALGGRRRRSTEMARSTTSATGAGTPGHVVRLRWAPAAASAMVSAGDPR